MFSSYPALLTPADKFNLLRIKDSDGGKSIKINYALRNCFTLSHEKRIPVSHY